MDPNNDSHDESPRGPKRTSYRRHLPHHVPPGFPIFLTWNLKGALPQRAIDELREQEAVLQREARKTGETEQQRRVRHAKMLFAARDSQLDRLAYESVRLESLTYGDRPLWLNDPRAACTVVESLLWGVSQRYDLLAWVVMANHVHVLLTPRVELSTVTQGIKGWTAHAINRIQNHRGRTFWQDECYDHWARDEAEMIRIIEYIENNPVVAGLCESPERYLWSSAYWRSRLGWRGGEFFKAEWKPDVLGELATLRESAWKG